MMRYFRTIHQLKSVIATIFVMSILLFLMYAFGMKYQDPPEEYGVAIRFGTTDIARELPIADKNTLSIQHSDVR